MSIKPMGLVARRSRWPMWSPADALGIPPSRCAESVIPSQQSDHCSEHTGRAGIGQFVSSRPSAQSRAAKSAMNELHAFKSDADGVRAEFRSCIFDRNGFLEIPIHDRDAHLVQQINRTISAVDDP